MLVATGAWFALYPRQVAARVRNAELADGGVPIAYSIKYSPPPELRGASVDDDDEVDTSEVLRKNERLNTFLRRWKRVWDGSWEGERVESRWIRSTVTPPLL